MSYIVSDNDADNSSCKQMVHTCRIDKYSPVLEMRFLFLIVFLITFSSIKLYLL